MRHDGSQRHAEPWFPLLCPQRSKQLDGDARLGTEARGQPVTSRQEWYAKLDTGLESWLPTRPAEATGYRSTTAHDLMIRSRRSRRRLQRKLQQEKPLSSGFGLKSSNRGVHGASRVAPVGELGPESAEPQSLRASQSLASLEPSRLRSGQASLLDDLATAVGGSQKLSLLRPEAPGAWLWMSPAPGGPSQLQAVQGPGFAKCEACRLWTRGRWHRKMQKLRKLLPSRRVL